MPKVFAWKRFGAVDWYSGLHAVLVGLFLLQFVQWIVEEEVVWLPETVALVKWTLGIVCATFFIRRISVALRTLVQLVSILFVHGKYLGYEFVPVRVRTLETFQLWLQENMLQLFPFLWFSLGAWLVYMYALWIVQTKLRIYLMILLSVLFFAIRDSFSLLVLWQETAIILFCGLSLLVVRHFADLRKKAPRSWEALSESPAAIFLPIGFLLAVVILVGAVMPSINPILTDPYTAWKISRGEPVSLSGKGIGASFSGIADTSSGYSRDDSRLGGGFQFDYSPVMTVDTTRKGYWRGETRSFYNGAGWEPGEAERRPSLTRVGAGNLAKDPRFDISRLETVEVKQTVEMKNQEAYPVLFGAFSIKQVLELNKGETGTEGLRWSPKQSELRVAPRSIYPNQYTIVSEEPVVNEAELRKTTANYAGKPGWDEFLQLPEELPARVKQLALDITQKASNPYDKVKSIEKYLSMTYPYTNTPDQKKGKSRDFVDRFLFEIQEGYCDYYSTAMTVLTRSLGIPARWVKGYSSGQSSLPDDLMEFGAMSQLIMNSAPDGAGSYTIRNSDAHSWVEVYFEGWGWIPFEPTSGFTFPAVYPEIQPQPVALLDSEAPAILPSTPADTGAVTGVKVALIVASLLALAALAALLFVKLGAWAAVRERWKKRYTSNFNHKIIVEFERLLRYGRRKGYSRQEHETIREAAARWTRQSMWLKADLDTALQLFEKAKYSQADASEQDFAKLSQAVEKLRSQMK